MGKVIQLTNYIHAKNTRGNPMCQELIENIRKKSININDMPAIADDILKYFHIDAFNFSVPIVLIMKNLGFKIYESSLEPKGLSAYIAVNPQFSDIYNSNKITCVQIYDNIGHKRFALAHELAHYIFDFKESADLYYYNTYFPEMDEDTIEQRANKFAANLLMPENAFKSKLYEYEKLHNNSKSNVVSALSNHFLVSPTAVLRRFEELNISEYMA